ncbi:hypothetical protein LZC95_07495 [Pendulispora brunnea]|uniref:Keratin associated protein n=1 Tax=Pendulispora brunnea TaxID=2905690 RepID=A0ABZ2KDG8_9BACT
MKNRFMPGIVVAVLGLPLFANGCSDDANNPLCCNEFEVGATVDVNVAGTAQGRVAAQAVADVAGIAAAAVDDLTTACRGIAQDLDAPADKQDAADAETNKNKQMQAWCKLAVDQITSFKAGATLTVQATPPVCEASISAKADCQAKCSVDGKCDVKVNPPTCTGGKLEVACKGECTAKAGATLSCEGQCTGSCSGSCTASGGVECAGKCDGTCTASAGGNGPQADGTCKGKCSGTCSVTAPNVQCNGSCSGTCSASCKGTAEASVKCDGECKADYEPISCKGGKLEGGCQVDAKCDANCSASVQAKASCTPPSIDIKFNVDSGKIGKLVATLKANLPIIFSLKTRLEAMVDITGQVSANINAIADVKPACIPALVGAAGQALANVKDSASASASITASVGK